MVEKSGIPSFSVSNPFGNTDNGSIRQGILMMKNKASFPVNDNNVTIRIRFNRVD